MKGNQRYNYRDRIIEEAADWFTRLQDPQHNLEDDQAFADWLCASAEHVQEYLAITNLHTGVKELPTTRSVEELIETARHAHAANVFPLGRLCVPEDGKGLTAREDTGRGRVKRLARLAASLAIVTLAGVWWLYPNVNTNTYITSIGEQKSFPLSDGSVVTLNAVSKLRIRYTERYRDVQLLSGEALFTVAKNKLRPFRVLTNDSVTQAVGTQFDVYHRGAETIVTVVEGTVDFSAPQLPEHNSAAGVEVGGSSRIVRVTKGQRARLGVRSEQIMVSATNPAVATAWRERRLTFESRPLAEVVAQFNLYNRVPFEIRDSALNTVQVSGSFNANDPQSFAAFLQEARLAEPTVQPDRIILLPEKR